MKNFDYVFKYSMKPVKDTLLIAVLAAPIGGILSMVIAYLVVRKRFFGAALCGICIHARHGCSGNRIWSGVYPDI